MKRLSLLRNLAHNPDFVKLWASHATSVFGSAVTTIALPLTAIMLFDATAFQMGLLAALPQVPRLFFSLYFGTVIDRIRKRSLMISVQIIRGLLLGSIPLLAFLDLLNIGYLYFVAFTSGILLLLFQFSDKAYLVQLVSAENYLEGNAKLQFSSSVSQAVGPGLGGALVQLITAPMAIAVDAVSYFISAFLLCRIEKQEPFPETKNDKNSWWIDVKEGLKLILENIVLQRTIISSFFASAGASMVSAVMMLYFAQDLKLTPVLIGTVFSIGSVASIIGSMMATTISSRLGIGRTIILATFICGLAYFLYPIADRLYIPVLLVLIGAQAIMGFWAPIYYTNEVTIRQSASPPNFIGRVTSFRSFFAGGIGPFAALAGGILGEFFGLRATIIIGTSIFFSSVFFLAPLAEYTIQQSVETEAGA